MKWGLIRWYAFKPFRWLKERVRRALTGAHYHCKVHGDIWLECYTAREVARLKECPTCAYERGGREECDMVFLQMDGPWGPW